MLKKIIFAWLLGLEYNIFVNLFVILVLCFKKVIKSILNVLDENIIMDIFLI